MSGMGILADCRVAAKRAARNAETMYDGRAAFDTEQYFEEATWRIEEQIRGRAYLGADDAEAIARLFLADLADDCTGHTIGGRVALG